MKNLPTNETLTCECLSDMVVDNMMEEITDYLTEKYGYCINDLEVDLDIKVSNINWDTEES